jgi:microsomal dipeptidase-like Zn-dependent dipeptidase
MTNYRIDNLQYCSWSEEIFKMNRDAHIDAVHVTIAYHEDFDEVKNNVKDWNDHFEKFSHLIIHGKTFQDIERAQQENKTAIFFGFQNCSPIEDNINLVESVHDMGAVFMQLTYNNQSLLATGCYETNDSGVTRMGKEVIKEMNRVGIVVDMSHSAEKSSLDAIEISEKPIAITHANPSFWHNAKRNKSNDLLKALADSGGMIGLSLYPHHLLDGSDCTLESFCSMIAKVADLIGTEHIGIGSDLCLNQSDAVVDWMRNGTWTKTKDFGEGSSANPSFPQQPDWFKDTSGFNNIEQGLKAIGFSDSETNGILGNNWFNFYKSYIK